ncbi:MAG: aromatic amino acid lyase [Acidimicrobiaceae bacterium]|nr:aromatic amino acid lyase [Acidimicrobiaceae bacterium]
MGLKTSEFLAISEGCEPVELSAGCVAAVEVAAARLETLIDAGATIYGVTTGYGISSASRLLRSEFEAFQLDTVRSHACGTGDPLEFPAARGVWLAKLLSVCTGLTGASLALAQQLVALLNTGLAPVVPRTGSLGASGDLVPSAHAGLCLLLLGQFMDKSGRRYQGSHIQKEFGIDPLRLGPRDGLSIVNGTATTLSLALHASSIASRLLSYSDSLVAAGIEAVSGHPEAFSEEIAVANGLTWVVRTSEAVRAGLSGWSGSKQTRTGVHDPYAWRCAPQVHGAAHWARAGLEEVIGDLLKGCSDNPLITDQTEPQIISGGNFHAVALGVASDALLIALVQVSALTRQRCYQMLAGKVGFEVGLIAPGEFGNGLSQLLATATALHLEIASTQPASMYPYQLDEVEDHVSNATLATVRITEVLKSLSKLLAIESLLIGRIFELSGGTVEGFAGVQLLKILKRAGLSEEGRYEFSFDIDRLSGSILAGEGGFEG